MMSKKSCLFSAQLLVLIIFVMVAGVPDKVWGATGAAVESADHLSIIVGELENVPVSSLTRVSLTDPNIADIVNVTESEILLIGKAVGQTVLFIWDDKGKRTVMIQVAQQNLDQIKQRIEKLLRDADISEPTVQLNEKEGKIIILGDVPAHKMEDFTKIIEPFNTYVINLAEKQEQEDLIQVDMQITELSQTLSQSLGVEWGNSGSGSGNDSLVLTYPETLPSTDGSFSDYFKIGDFNRTSPLLATVNALIQEGKGRILSKPKLVVVSGEEARFLVGGQIPFRTTTTTGSSSQENIEFKSYGVGMTITPTIKKGKIDIVLSTEISDVDSANAVGEDVAFTTRSANTRLFLDDRQTIILAGLIKHNDNESVKRVPLLGSIPVVGLLFRSKSNPVANTDTEIVISLTPTILTKHVEKNRVEKDEINELNESIDSSDEIENSADNMINGSEGDVDEEVNAGAQEHPTADTLSPEMLEYIQAVQQKISNAIVYPAEAKEYGWEGTVRLGMLILSDGSLAYGLVKESSGYDIFDENALNTAKKVAPYDAFPASTNLMELNVTIPIVYSLERK